MFKKCIDKTFGINEYFVGDMKCL